MLARLLLGALMLLACGCAPAPAATEPTRLRVAATGAGNTASVAVADQAATLALSSERGIGELTLAHEAGPFPQRITLRMALVGLEELRLSYGEQTIVASVSSALPHTISQLARTPDGRELALAPDDRRWIAIQLSPEQLAQPFPLDEPALVITLPPDLIAAAPRELTIGWIDFFR